VKFKALLVFDHFETIPDLLTPSCE